MQKNKIFFVLYFSASLLLNSNLEAQSFLPQYRTTWDKVYTHILNTWSASKTNENTWQMPGSLKIPLPYFSLYANRNVLYGWDTYFTNLGLLKIDTLAIYARNATENQMYEVEQVGYVPNCSEPWAHNRPQTPFLSMMVRDVYEHGGLADKDWLLKAYNILKREYHFWTDTSKNAIEDHTTKIPGLQRFGHHATKEELLKFFSVLAERFHLSDSLPEAVKLNYANNWMAEAASGMDFTPRFEGRCPEFVALELNFNLYQYEINFAWMVQELGLSNEPDWNNLAQRRKDLINKYCWNEKRGLYLDYDYVNNRHSKTASVATFYSMYVKMATKEQAKRMVSNLKFFEFPYGPAVCEFQKHAVTYQWDYPAGWPPMYFLVVKALDNYGYKKEAKRIASKYLEVVSKNFLEPVPVEYIVLKKGNKETKTRTKGHVYEKYIVTDGSINDLEYSARTFHGWSYGVYVWCYHYVNASK